MMFRDAVHPSSVEAASQLHSYLTEKLSGSVCLGEKGGRPVLFNTYKAQDIAPVKVVKAERFAAIGFTKGMEAALWDAYRERHKRQQHILGTDEQDYGRDLILKGNEFGLDEVARVGDYANIDQTPIDEDDYAMTSSFAFKNEALESDEELIASFKGAQEAHIAKIRKNIANAQRVEVASRVKGNKSRFVGSVCASKVHRLDFDASEAKQAIREELELVYRKSKLADCEVGQEPEDWLDELYAKVELMKENAWKAYHMSQRIHAANSQALKNTSSPAGRQTINGIILNCSFDATKARANAMRFDTILGVIENEMSNIAEGGLEDQTHEYGALLRDVLDNFEHQFATREGGVAEIDDRVSIWQHKPTREGQIINQHLGYSNEEFADFL